MMLEILLIMTLVILITSVLIFDREIKKHKQEILDLQTTLYLSQDKLKRMEGYVGLIPVGKFYISSNKGIYSVKVKTLNSESTIKKFDSDDADLNRINAEELLEKLNDND